MSVCVSVASDSSETIEVIIITFGTAPASDMLMHHVFVIQFLIMEIINILIISETVQAILIKFAVKIVRLKV